MRLALILPPVQPEVYPAVTGCPYAGCGGQHLQHWQAVPKPLRDTQLHEVTAQRYRCVRCGRTFRLYPAGVSHDQTSARLKGVAVMFYVLGMSYGAVATALAALGWPLSKVAVYYAVQEAGAAVAGLRREVVRHGGGRVVALGADLTSVRCGGQWLTVGVSVDAVRGTALSIDLLPHGDAATLSAWIQDLADVLDAQILVSDDADPFKTAADENGLLQQICKSHVLRNTEAWVQTITSALEADSDGSLAAMRVSPAQAIADCQEVLRLMIERQPIPEASATLAAIHRRYLGAAKPLAGESMSLAYRLRLFSLDRWNLWPRLTRYRSWAGPGGETLDGTNNACERAIGWWVKERYRSMRGYKRSLSVLNVSRLIAAMGNALEGPGFALAEVIV
ncbi:MAG: putative transposase for insertion sequence element [Thermomicrobiales bacterium]|jgi:transposase-like protein|nr:putative transposase for insertion sequence element [Thermomicrobiales bacterium]